ncbi:MAG TPA: MFS transporter, partial [Acidimicrobiia bacterium]|nr:MFS transporter [Acidimicrobiia bacterium]
MRGVVRVFGPEPLSALVRVHSISTAADACITVSLAGSLFFAVSVDAARPRLALYLLLTLAPFAIVAPLIGPVTDRFRGAAPAVIAVTGQARAILALFIAIDLRGLLLYPESFAVLVLGRSYSIVKRALVPELVPDANDLVAANARLSRVGSVSGALGGALAVAVFQASGPTAVLRLAAILHVVGALLAFRIPSTSAVPETVSA